MSEPVWVTVDNVQYKVHDNGDVYRVNRGFVRDSTRHVGNLPRNTPQNQLADKIRAMPNR